MTPTSHEGSPVAAWRSLERVTPLRPRGSGAGLKAAPLPEVDGATILRVISAFDDLVERGGSLDDVVRTVALTTECACRASAAPAAKCWRTTTATGQDLLLASQRSACLVRQLGTARLALDCG